MDEETKNYIENRFLQERELNNFKKSMKFKKYKFNYFDCFIGIGIGITISVMIFVSV